jgi:hypothetical protein
MTKNIWKSKVGFFRKWEGILLILSILSLFSCGDSGTGSGSGTVNPDWLISVQPLLTAIKAGGGTTQVNILVTDSKGSPPPIKDQNGYTVTNSVYLSTDLGSVDTAVTLDNSGWGVATYTSGTKPGLATIRATFKGSVGQATILTTSTLI